MLLALLSVAFAHPGSALGGGTAGAPVIGQRIELGVTRERVSLAYVAELPLRRVSDEAQSWEGEGTFAAAKIEELKGGLTLHVDGVPARLEWQPVVDAARTGDPGFVQLHLLGTIEPGVSRARISIRNE